MLYCVVLFKGIDKLFLPVAHGEGNFYLEPEALAKLEENNQVVFQYVDENGNPAKKQFKDIFWR